MRDSKQQLLRRSPHERGGGAVLRLEADHEHADCAHAREGLETWHVTATEFKQTHVSANLATHTLRHSPWPSPAQL